MKSKSSGTTTEGNGRRHGMLTPGSGAATVLAILALVFIFENTQNTDIRLLVPVVTMPLWVALLVVALVGVLVGGYVHWRRRRR